LGHPTKPRRFGSHDRIGQQDRPKLIVSHRCDMYRIVSVQERVGEVAQDRVGDDIDGGPLPACFADYQRHNFLCGVRVGIDATIDKSKAGQQIGGACVGAAVGLTAAKKRI